MESKHGVRNFLKKLHKYRIYLLMLAPAVIYTLIFAYYPMTGIVMAFKKYNYSGGIWGSPWNGLENFKFFFKSGQAGLVTRNTVLYNIAFILVGTFAQVAVAVFLTEIHGKRFRKLSQFMMFLPYFISWVIVGVMAFNIFSSNYGFLNRLIVAVFNIWKGVGYGSVMYLAAILLMMSVGGIFKGNFDMFYNLVGSNELLYNYTDVIDTLAMRALISSNDFGMSAAIGLFQSVLCFITVTIVNKLVGMYDKDYALF